jgi:hypothetical protein
MLPEVRFALQKELMVAQLACQILHQKQLGARAQGLKVARQVAIGMPTPETPQQKEYQLNELRRRAEPLNAQLQRAQGLRHELHALMEIMRPLARPQTVPPPMPQTVPPPMPQTVPPPMPQTVPPPMPQTVPPPLARPQTMPIPTEWLTAAAAAQMGPSRPPGHTVPLPASWLMPPPREPRP